MKRYNFKHVCVSSLCRSQVLSTGSHLFAAGVVQQLDVAGVKRLSGVHRHQNNFVSNHHLQSDGHGQKK